MQRRQTARLTRSAKTLGGRSLTPGQRVQGVQRAKMVRRLLTGSAPRRGANSLISPAAHAAVASEAVKGGSRLPPVEATESIRD
eukprot:9496102-Pyramimonas_sp.AAC.1